VRIVFVINSLIYGGAETQVMALSRQLAAQGHAVAIYTLRRENPRAPELDGSGVDIVADCKAWKFDVALLARLRRFFHAFRADIVHGFLFDGNLYATLAAAGTGIPALMSERTDNYVLPLRQRLGLELTRHLAAGLVANSHAGARFTQPILGMPDADVHVVWNGIDTDDESAHENGNPAAMEFFGSADVKVACMVAQMRPEKDQCFALRVARALVGKSPAWRVLLVGDCLPQTRAYKETVLRLYDELALGSSVVFAGLRRDVKKIIRGSNVLFCTSQREGFPNVVLEAMSVGTPVVSTDYSDIRLILPTPWQVVANRAPEDVAEAIIRADAERQALAVRQREWLEQHGTIAMAARRLDDVYSCYAVRTT